MIANLARPGKLVLTIYTLWILPVVAVLLYELSFTWFFDYEWHVELIFYSATLILILTFFTDWKLDIRIARYVFVFIAVFIGLVVLSYPVKTWLVKKSELQAAQIGVAVEEYRRLNGTYPENLEADFFKDLPKRSFVGTLFYASHYPKTQKQETSFFISYFCFNGSTGYYNTQTGSWRYSSD
jgi:hypothetical protein